MGVYLLNRRGVCPNDGSTLGQRQRRRPRVEPSFDGMLRDEGWAVRELTDQRR